MTEHLPECIYAPEEFDFEQNIVWGGKPCICDRLRACEQRVLDAAREAVRSMVIETVGNSAATVEQAVSVIDALREKT